MELLVVMDLLFITATIAGSLVLVNLVLVLVAADTAAAGRILVLVHSTNRRSSSTVPGFHLRAFV